MTEYKYINETLKTLWGAFIPPVFRVLVEVGSGREVNTSAYLSHWFQGSCYGLSLQISFLYSPPATSPPPSAMHHWRQVRYFNFPSTDVVGCAGGESDFRSPGFPNGCAAPGLLSLPRSEHMFPSGMQQRSMSPSFSVHLKVSWHSWCNKVSQDWSGPLSLRWRSPGQTSVPAPRPHLRDRRNDISWQQVWRQEHSGSLPAAQHAHTQARSCDLWYKCRKCMFIIWSRKNL